LTTSLQAQQQQKRSIDVIHEAVNLECCRQKIHDGTTDWSGIGGGVGWGWAHIGVIKGLQKAGMKANVISGTSIGTLVAGMHLAGQLEALENWAAV